MSPQQSLDQIKTHIESLKQQLGGKDGINVVNITDLDTARTILRGLQEEADDLATSFGDMASTLANIVGELNKSDTATKSATKAYRGLVSIAQKMQYEEEGIYAYNVKQLDTLHLQAQAQLKNLQTSIDRLTPAEKATTEGQALLKALEDQYAIENNLITAIEKRLKLEKQVEKTAGATGAILESTTKVLDKLGFGHLSSEIGDLNNKLKAELREEIAKSDGQAANLGTSFKYVGKAISGSAKILAEGLKDPLFIIKFIVDALNQGSQNMADLQKQTGMSYTNAYKLNTEMNAVAAGTGDAFITGQKLVKTYASLTGELGVSADILGNDALVSATNLEQRLGMSAEQSSKLTVFTRLQGKNTEKILSNAFATVGAFNRQNKTAINVRAVMDDVANASTSTYLNMGKNVVALTQAATKAASLGLSLKDLETVADSLLDFESSIGKELEAQLLTGESLNLAKAREYAMTGDMKGLGEEIGKQEAVTNAFRTKNVIAQKATADALGLTVEQLAGITMKQELAKLGAEKFKEVYGETAYEATLARSASEGFGDAMEKVKSIIGSLIQVFTPILDALVYVLNIPFVPQILAAVVLFKVLGSSIMGSVRGIGAMSRGALDFVSNIKKGGLANFFKGIGGNIKSLGADLKGNFMGQVKSKSGKWFDKDSPQGKMIANMKSKTPDIPTDKAESVAGGADKAGKSGNAEGFKQKMVNIAEGLKAFGNTKVLFGAFNLIPSSIGLIAMIPGLIGAKLIEQINGEKFQESMLGLATGIEAMGKGKVFLGSLGLIAASVGLIAMIPGVLGGLILAAAATPISMGLKILGEGLEAFGESMMTGYGLVGLAAVAVGALALGAALNLAAPGIQAFGTVVTAVFAGLATLVTAVANGFVTMMGAVTMEKIGPMLLLGPALFGIAAGLGALSFAGLMALPAIGGLVMLAAVSPALVSLADAFGMGGDSAGEAKAKSDKGSMEGVEKKLDALIMAVKAGRNVYLDTNKVGKAQVLGSYKLG